jgi:hypothetical protein
MKGLDAGLTSNGQCSVNFTGPGWVAHPGLPVDKINKTRATWPAPIAHDCWLEVTR